MADPKLHYCVNCKEFGHGAVDKDCPAYIEQQDRQDSVTPGNLFKYYPMPDPTTWEYQNQYRPPTTPIAPKTLPQGRNPMLSTISPPFSHSTSPADILKEMEEIAQILEEHGIRIPDTDDSTASRE